MNVFYDYQAFTKQIYGGVSNYYYQLLKYLSKHKKISIFLSQKYSNNQYIKKLELPESKTFFENLPFRGKYRLMNYFNQKSTLKHLMNIDFDIFHPTYYDPYFLKYIEKKLFVLTIFDMIHEKFIKNKKDKTAVFKKQLAEKADKIIAISENTKKDIRQILSIQNEKIEVIHPGGGFTEEEISSSIPIDLPDKYLFYQGSRVNYKNFSGFITAVASVLKAIDGLKIVCGGGGILTREEKGQFQELNILDRVIQISIPSESLAYTYKKALLFIYPSLYEGFGISILEAFSCGCPVAASNRSSFLEVGGEAILYFDPKNHDLIREAVYVGIQNEKKRQRAIKAGYLQHQKFSWQRMGEETLNLYKLL